MTAASATAITADELLDLFYSLKAPYRKKAVWVLNDSTIKAVRKLKDSTGQYLWQPALTAGNYRIMFRNAAYNIRSIDWMNYQNESVKIKTTKKRRIFAGDV